MAVYLLHFDRPYKHARHYLGWAYDGKVNQRIKKHRQGLGARILKVILSAGIDFQLAIVIEGADRTVESKLKKNGHIKRLCPLCKRESKLTATPMSPMDG